VIRRAVQIAPVTLRATFEPATLNVESRTVECIFYSGSVVQRFSLFEGAFELVFDMSPEAARLERLNNGAPLLDTHNTGQLSSILGVVEKAWLAGGRAHARVRFSERAEVEPIFRDVQARIIRNVSMGVVIHKAEDITEKGAEVRRYRATDWEPTELSLLAVNADPNAQTLGEQHQLPHRRPNNMRKKKCPSCETALAADYAEATCPNEACGVDLAEAEAERCELARQGEAHRLAEAFGCGDVWARRMIQSGASLAQMRLSAAEDRARRAPTLSTNIGFGDTHDAGTQLHARMAQALADQALGKAPSEEARELYGLGFTGIAHHILHAQRQHTWIPKGRAGDARAVELALTTSDYPAILGDSARRMLLPRYQAAQPTYRFLCARRDFRDFREHSLVRPGDFPLPLEVKEEGEIKQGYFGESQEVARLLTYGRIVSISRQALVNDDLGAFADVMNAWGQRLADLENALFFSLLTSAAGAGPTMKDGGAFFNATAVTTLGGHANLTSSGTAISDDSLNIGASQMMQQVGLGSTGLGDGIKLNIQPRYLLAAPSKRQAAFRYTSAEFSPAAPTSINTFAGILTPLLDANLSGNRWYLFADPAALPAFVYGSLASEPGPRVATRVGFEVEGVQMKVAMDFGVAALEWRAAYSNAGA
jgi:hypothetical protein